MRKDAWPVLMSLVLLAGGCAVRAATTTEGDHRALPPPRARLAVLSNDEPSRAEAVKWLKGNGYRIEDAKEFRSLPPPTQSEPGAPFPTELLAAAKRVGADAVLAVHVDVAPATVERPSAYGASAEPATFYRLQVAVRLVEPASGTSLLQGRAQFTQPYADRDAGLRHLTVLALRRAWCPPGRWMVSSVGWEDRCNVSGPLDEAGPLRIKVAD
jgi:hypothetical protein